jgi:hypothetical protein
MSAVYHSSTNCLTRDLQDSLYSGLNEFSIRHGILGRLASIPVSIIDVALDLVQTPFLIAERVIRAATNVFGVALNAPLSLCGAYGVCGLGCASVKNVLQHVEFALNTTLTTPGRVVMAPFKIVYQLGRIAYDPVTAKSYDHANHAVSGFWDYCESISDCFSSLVPQVR